MDAHKWEYWLSEFILVYINTTIRGPRRLWLAIQQAINTAKSQPWLPCDMACEWDNTYGWVIEADCPVHDIQIDHRGKLYRLTLK